MLSNSVDTTPQPFDASLPKEIVAPALDSRTAESQTAVLLTEANADSRGILLRNAVHVSNHQKPVMPATVPIYQCPNEAPLCASLFDGASDSQAAPHSVVDVPQQQHQQQPYLKRLDLQHANSSSDTTSSGVVRRPFVSVQQHQPYQQQNVSYAVALLGAKLHASPPPVSTNPRFFAIKSAEYPSLPLPNFKILNYACPLFPQHSLVEPTSSRPADDYQVHSDGDAVPRIPIPRKQLSSSLRSSHWEFNAKLKRGRVPFAFPVIRKKWKKTAHISLPDPIFSNQASDFNGQSMGDLYKDESEDDSSVEYESVWRSSTSDDEADTDYEIQLALEASLKPEVYNDFSVAPL